MLNFDKNSVIFHYQHHILFNVIKRIMEEKHEKEA